ncbi:puromycin-sensitive aminopeptidase [Scenedesmus sp. PABB004]|nr:puromycin-sensitive aminopeptidase [Scenedesmus sp. PABB004]
MQRATLRPLASSERKASISRVGLREEQSTSSQRGARRANSAQKQKLHGFASHWLPRLLDVQDAALSASTRANGFSERLAAEVSKAQSALSDVMGGVLAPFQGEGIAANFFAASRAPALLEDPEQLAKLAARSPSPPGAGEGPPDEELNGIVGQIQATNQRVRALEQHYSAVDTTLLVLQEGAEARDQQTAAYADALLALAEDLEVQEAEERAAAEATARAAAEAARAAAEARAAEEARRDEAMRRELEHLVSEASAVQAAEGGPAADGAAAGAPRVVKVEVGVQAQTKFGQRVVLVGDHPALGNWSVDGALPLTWSEGHVWKASLELPADSASIEYKAVLCGDNSAVWERGSNHVAELGGSADVALFHVFKAACRLQAFAWLAVLALVGRLELAAAGAAGPRPSPSPPARRPRDAGGGVVRRVCYAPPPWLVPAANLTIALAPLNTTVESRLALAPNPDWARWSRSPAAAAARAAGCAVPDEAAGAPPLVLDGRHLALRDIRLDGAPLPPAAYELTPRALALRAPPAAPFTLRLRVALSPALNPGSEGMFQPDGGGGGYATQCEPQARESARGARRGAARRGAARRGAARPGRRWPRPCGQRPPGFRRITFWPDRPDVLSVLRVRVEAGDDAGGAGGGGGGGGGGGAPLLFSNGNPRASGAAPGGRRFVEWADPHPKPSYLFAVVAGGDLALREAAHMSAAGVATALRAAAPAALAGRLGYALAAARQVMAWDEAAFGRQYDLEVWHMVTVPGLSTPGARARARPSATGAPPLRAARRAPRRAPAPRRRAAWPGMENKGLATFRPALLAVALDSHTDDAAASVRGLIAHEYLHNWSGNRVTVRDWFELTLKEGLTALREQLFSADVDAAGLAAAAAAAAAPPRAPGANSTGGGTDAAALQELRRLAAPGAAATAGSPGAGWGRVSQAQQIRGAAASWDAQAMRPDSYESESPDELYSAAAYSKARRHRRGRRKRCAVVFEDLHAALAATAPRGLDLSGLLPWLSATSTPRLRASASLDRAGGALMLRVACDACTDRGGAHRLVPLTTFTLRLGGGAPAGPAAVSWLRAFSAPVLLALDADGGLAPPADGGPGGDAFLALHDGDAFARWDAFSRLANGTLLRLYAAAAAAGPDAPEPSVAAALAAAVDARGGEGDGSGGGGGVGAGRRTPARAGGGGEQPGAGLAALRRALAAVLDDPALPGQFQARRAPPPAQPALPVARAVLTRPRDPAPRQALFLELPGADLLMPHIPAADPLLLYQARAPPQRAPIARRARPRVRAWATRRLAAELQAPLQAAVAHADATLARLRALPRGALGAPEDAGGAAATAPDGFTPAAMHARAVKNGALGMLATLGTPALRRDLERRYRAAAGLTDALAALTALAPWPAAQAAALQDFQARPAPPGVAAERLRVQAAAPGAAAALRALLAGPASAFDASDDEQCDALLLGFADDASPAFHARDGSGYALAADAVLAVDTDNPDCAQALVGALSPAGDGLAPAVGARMCAALARLAAARARLSRGTAEAVAGAAADCAAGSGGSA